MWWWYTVIYKCQMSLESLHDKSMQAKSLTTPHPHLYDWVQWSERTCPRHEETVLPVSAKWEGDSLLPWEMSCRSEESGFRTKASQIILHHQGKLRLRKERDTHTVKESRKEPRVKWILCPGIGWRLIVSDWEYLLKFCVHKLQLSFPSLTLYSVPYKLSWEQNIYIQKCLLQHCLWRRKSILNNMTPFLDIICVCRSTQRKQLKNMHTSLVLCEVKF